MTKFEWLTLFTSVITLLLVPTLALLVRLAVRWTRTEDKLNELVDDMNRLASASDRRLRWLEENLWRRK